MQYEIIALSISIEPSRTYRVSAIQRVRVYWMAPASGDLIERVSRLADNQARLAPIQSLSTTPVIALFLNRRGKFHCEVANPHLTTLSVLGYCTRRQEDLAASTDLALN